MLSILKRKLLPSGLVPRTLPMGLGRGIVMDIDFAHETRLFLGLYELEVARHIRRMCSPGAVSYDVGGQHGYDALVFAKLTGGRVESFECSDSAVARMRHSFGQNAELASLINLVHAMVGAGNDGTLALDEHGGPRPDFLKVDVEGAEYDVLRGAGRILTECRPHLLIEVHSLELERECGRLLTSLGYQPIVVHQRRVLPDYRPDPHNRWVVAYGERSRPDGAISG